VDNQYHWRPRGGASRAGVSYLPFRSTPANNGAAARLLRFMLALHHHLRCQKDAPLGICINCWLCVVQRLHDLGQNNISIRIW
jgi:hypothetical protein